MNLIIPSTMKRIVIEAYAITTPYVGVGEFCKRLGEGLANQAVRLREHYGIEFYFIVPPSYRGCFGNEVHYICMPVFMRHLLTFYPFKTDLFHMPHQYCLFKNLRHVTKRLMTIHDINFIYEKQGKKLERGIQRFQQKIKRMDYTNYISEFVRKDTNKHFHIRVPERVIYNGVSALSVPSEISPRLVQQLPDSFLFHLSSLLPKKNVHLLIEMMRFLPEQNLVIAGNWNSSYGKMLQKMIDELPTRNVYRLPNVTEEEKAYLYASCRAFLYPSLCEGFGLPPIEAMKFGKPVFLSALTSLPEVGGEHAFYWNELSPETMAEKIKEMLPVFYNHPDYALQMRQNAERFNWNNCVNQYIQYYLEILAS